MVADDTHAAAISKASSLMAGWPGRTALITGGARGDGARRLEDVRAGR